MIFLTKSLHSSLRKTMKKYFIHNGNKQSGPFDIEEIKSQSLDRNTQYWCEGMDDWKPITELIPVIPPPLKTPQTPPKQNVWIDQDLKNKKSILYVIIGIVAIAILVWIISSINENSNKVKEIEYEKNSEEFENKINDENKLANEKALTAKNMNYRNNWESFISSHNSEYLYSEIGGISSLNVNVENNTDYILDEVSIIVNYIKKNGGTYKTEEVIIYNVPAHSIKSQAAPDSERGTSVSTEISSIISKKMHFCYPLNNGNPKDPYFCK